MFGLRHLTDWFIPPPAPVASPPCAGAAIPQPKLDVTESVYPPVDPGIPFRSIESILSAQTELIERVKICYGVDTATFEQDILALIQRYAEYVHLLPATPDNYFNVPGGLLRLGIEAAFFSLQGTDGHIFAGRSTISVRRHLEPRWRHAAFIAGLCCEVHRTLSHVIVTDDSGCEWQPYLMPLSHWLVQQNAKRYFLKWRPNAHETRSLGVFVLPHIIPDETLARLANGNNVIVPHMMASISGMPVFREHNILDDLVKRSVALVIDRYLQASADRYGTPQLGSHLERYLLDALRRLVKSSGCWLPNADKTHAWFGSDGLFLLWPNAAVDICKLLEADQLPGIPKAPETILEIMTAAGVFEPQSRSCATWQIVPPEHKVAIEAVKLSSPAIVFAGLETSPKPLSVALVRSAATPANVTTTESPACAPAPAHADDQKSRRTEQLVLPIDEKTASAEGDGALRELDSTGSNTSPLTSSPGSIVAPMQAPLFTQVPELPLQRFKLEAPIRLNPGVRNVLAQIVDTMNNNTSIAACTIATGLFIPLAQFTQRKIDLPVVLRALNEAGMLVLAKDTKLQTQARNFGGEQTIGLVIHPRFVGGLNPLDFDVADASNAPC